MSKRLENYIQHLFLIGCVGIISGGLFVVIIFQGKTISDFSIYNILLDALGVFWVYKLINDIGPGGSVNFYFGTNHKPNEDERLLNRIIAKYKSTFFVALPAIGYVISDMIIALSRYNTTFNIGFDEIVTDFFAIPFFIVGALMQGSKYLSAWWNIGRALRKDPTGEQLLLSVKNDPSLAKLDNPKPIINLPRIGKSIIKKIFKN